MNTFTDLLIDIDGTIIDTKEVERYALKKLFSKYALYYDEDILTKYSTINEKLWLEFEKGKIEKNKLRIKRFELLFNHMDIKADVQSFANEYFEIYSKTVIPFTNAVDTIIDLHNKYNLHIISNGSTDVQYYKLNKLNITQYFKNIFLSEEIGYAKPNKLFFQKVYDTLKQKNKNKILVIGDSISADITGGKDFGFKTCYVGNNISSAEFSIKTLTDIKKILIKDENNEI